MTNGYVKGFARGKLFTGRTKGVCVPGHNCYSCPGALGACPLGSLQASLTDKQFKISFYVVGFLIAVGALFGRFVCGWLCPFGLVQDLVYKIPLIKRLKKLRRLKKLPGDKFLRLLRYVVLALFVILLPMFAVGEYGQGSPWFCKYICPAGTLGAGIPLTVLNESLRELVSFLFAWKVVILAALLLLSLIIYRPFCRYLCPLGAIYGIFNPISLTRYRIDAEKCTKCGKCQGACKLDIPVYEKPNCPDCIRCGDCKKACPFGAIK